MPDRPAHAMVAFLGEGDAEREGRLHAAHLAVRERLTAFFCDRFEKASYDAQSFADEVIQEAMLALVQSARESDQRKPVSV